MRTKLQQNEETVLVVKQHWIVLLKPFLIVLLTLIVYSELTKVKLLGIESVLRSMSAFVYTFSIVYFLYMYYERKVNIWVVTNIRLIDEWGVITRRAKESSLEKINNVDISQTIIGRIFNYGSVSIQTAATSGETWIRYVEKPLVLQETIMRAVRQNEREGEQSPQCTVKETANLNIVKCPHCGMLIQENAVDSPRMPPKASESKETYNLSPGLAKSQERPAKEETGDISTAQPEPHERVGRQNAAPSIPQQKVEPIVDPQTETFGNATTADPYDWKRR